jgi:hypothetical protein
VTWWRPEKGSPLTNGDVHVNVHSSCFSGWGFGEKMVGTRSLLRVFDVLTRKQVVGRGGSGCSWVFCEVYSGIREGKD